MTPPPVTQAPPAPPCRDQRLPLLVTANRVRPRKPAPRLTPPIVLLLLRRIRRALALQAQRRPLLTRPQAPQLRAPAVRQCPARPRLIKVHLQPAALRRLTRKRLQLALLLTKTPRLPPALLIRMQARVQTAKSCLRPLLLCRCSDCWASGH